jgi:aminopeptidase N
MKIILSVSFFVLYCIGVGAKDGYTRNPSIDIIHYDFSISVSDTNNIIYGHTLITVDFTRSVSTFEFDLKNKGTDGKGMTIINIAYDAGSIKWVHSGNKISITLDEPAKKGTRGLFTI